MLKSEDVPQPLEMHLAELRSRLIRSLLYVAACTLLAFSVHSELFKLVIEPATGLLRDNAGQIITTKPSEAFFAQMNVALIAGLILASPGIAFEFLAFLWPALPEKIRQFVLVLLPAIVGLFCAGVAFSYFVLVPIILKFFIGFATASNMTSLYTIGEYISFLTRMCLMTGAAFEVPIVVTLLSLVGVITGAGLRRQRPFAIVLILIAAAVLTPTGDPITMSLVAVPVYLLFEVSVLVVWFMEKARGKRARADSEELQET